MLTHTHTHTNTQLHKKRWSRWLLMSRRHIINQGQAQLVWHKPKYQYYLQTTTHRHTSLNISPPCKGHVFQTFFPLLLLLLNHQCHHIVRIRLYFTHLSFSFQQNYLFHLVFLPPALYTPFSFLNYALQFLCVSVCVRTLVQTISTIGLITFLLRCPSDSVRIACPTTIVVLRPTHTACLILPSLRRHVNCFAVVSSDCIFTIIACGFGISTWHYMLRWFLKLRISWTVS